jgi:hypothetical protein
MWPKLPTIMTLPIPARPVGGIPAVPLDIDTGGI